MDPIISGFVNSCWVFFKWGLLALVIGVVVAVPLLYERVDEEIRRRAQSEISQQFPQLRVTIRSAELLEGEGIVLRDLTISEPGEVGPGAEMLHVEEVFLACKTDPRELVSGMPQVHWIRVRRPTLRAVRRADGVWNLAKLACPLDERDFDLPDVTVEAGTIEILDQFSGATEALPLQNVHFSLTTPTDLDGPPSAVCRRRVAGSFSGDHVHLVEFGGLLDLAGPGWSLSGLVDGLDLSPDLLAALPFARERSGADWLGSLSGRLDFHYRLAGDWSGGQSSPRPSGAPCEFNVWGRLTQGRADDPRLPRPLGDVRAQFHAWNDGFSIKDLHAGSGRMKLERASLVGSGYDPGATISLTATVRDLELDRSLMNVLPPSLQEHWRQFDPAGHVDATLQLTRRSGRWTPDAATIDCKDVSFQYYKLPYRLDQAVGRIELKDGVLTVGQVHWEDGVRILQPLAAYSGGQRVELSGQVSQPLEAPFGGLLIRADALELDEKLFRALEGKPEARVVRSLNPRGSIGVYYTVWNEFHGEPLRKFLRVTPNGCAIRYEKFPHEINNIHGLLEMEDGRWEFRDLVGGNDTAEIHAEGYFHPDPAGSELLLVFSATDVPLEAELRDAIGQTHPNLRRLWNDLSLRGTIDLEELRVRYITGRKGLDVSFRAVPQPGTSSIDLIYCPYHLEDLRGTLEYVDGDVTVWGFQATHGDVKLAATANCRFDSDGSWWLGLTNLAVEQLRFDRELTQALPQRLARAVASLNPRGPFQVGGAVSVGRSAATAGQVWASWDVDIVALQAAIDFGVRLENISGTVTATGGYDEGRFYSQCELDLDSLTLLGTQFTQVTGPVWVDNQRVLLGEQIGEVEAFSDSNPTAPRNPAFAARPIQAQVFGGTAAANGRIVLGETPGYWINTSLSSADLARCARQMNAGRQNLQGRVDAGVELWGTGRSVNALQGRGRVQLRQADVYELPAMVRLLKLLSVREPDGTAFSSADVDFSIKGPHVYFSRVDFNGDAISLEGTGEMDFNSNVNLTFGTRLGRRETIIPALREILGGAGDQLVQIHVNGPLSDPRVSREPFPGINKTLQQIQNDLRNPIGLPGRISPMRDPRRAPPIGSRR